MNHRLVYIEEVSSSCFPGLLQFTAIKLPKIVQCLSQFTVVLISYKG